MKRKHLAGVIVCITVMVWLLSGVNGEINAVESGFRVLIRNLCCNIRKHCHMHVIHPHYQRQSGIHVNKPDCGQETHTRERYDGGRLGRSTE